MRGGKPYQSKLNPYRQEIARLRATRPPTPYVQIAKLMKEQHNLDVSPHTIWAFVKSRSKGRKVYAMRLEDEPEPPSPAAAQPAGAPPPSQPVDERPDWEPPPPPADGLTELQRKRRAQWQQEEKDNPPQ
jgi:hypothetical protein